jgi:hypothetical protein
MAHQLPAEQQHGHLVTIAGASRRVAIDVRHLEGNAVSRRQLAKLREHFLAQAASRPRVEQETHQETFDGVERTDGVERAVRRCRYRGGLPPKDLTEWAMNSTVWAGTSPTAVT